MRRVRVTEAAVDANDIVLGYGDHVAVTRSSFSIPQPGITAVIGPNGSGKSTILNAIAGLLVPMSGTITIPGGREGGKRISYVLQATKVNEALPVTVEEVVGMGRYASAGWFRRFTQTDRAKVQSAMERTGVTDLRRRHLHELSGGQRQRAFLAQGLAQDHRILLLDEPHSAIDYPTAQAIDNVIHNEIQDGCAVVVTTHDLTEAQAADHVVLLKGRVIASGPPRDVLTPENLTAAYGASVLHPGLGLPVIDDAAHAPVAGRRSHGAKGSDPTS